MREQLRQLRKQALEISAKGRDGNLQSIFSSMEILWTLYDRVLRITPELRNDPGRDIFVLSKGQATLGLLAVLSEKGFLPKTELDRFCQFDARAGMQADRTKLWDAGVEVSAGSLGHGFPIAAGMAWAAKIKNLDSRIFVLAGDGELNEGTMWEAALFAASENLKNLTLIVDDNGSIGRMLDVGCWRDKFTSFGFDTAVADGHNVDELACALLQSHERPLAVIAKTARGYGSPTLMEDASWFHRFPNEEELKMLKEEVDSF